METKYSTKAENIVLKEIQDIKNKEMEADIEVQKDNMKRLIRAVIGWIIVFVLDKILYFIK